MSEITIKPKIWRGGNADEGWKVDICKCDMRMVKETYSTVEYILGAPMENFTGRQIADAMNAYSESARRSIEKGLIETADIEVVSS